MLVRLLFRAMFRCAPDRRSATSILKGYAWTTYGYKFGRSEWSGSLWTMLFAGDIHIGRACWDQCANRMPVVFSHPLSMDRATALAEAGRMTPGGPHSEVVREAIKREQISDQLLCYTEARYQRAAFSAEPRATDAMTRRNRRGPCARQQSVGVSRCP